MPLTNMDTSDLIELFNCLNPNEMITEEELTPKSMYPDPYEEAIAQVKEEIKDAKTNELWKDGFKSAILLIETKAQAIKQAQPLPF